MFSSTMHMTYNATVWPIPANAAATNTRAAPQTPGVMMQQHAATPAPPIPSVQLSRGTRSPYTASYRVRDQDIAFPHAPPNDFEHGCRDVAKRIRNLPNAIDGSPNADCYAFFDADEYQSWVDDAFGVDREVEEAALPRPGPPAPEPPAEVIQQQLDDIVAVLNPQQDVEMIDVDGGEHESDDEDDEQGEQDTGSDEQVEQEEQDEADEDQFYEGEDAEKLDEQHAEQFGEEGAEQRTEEDDEQCGEAEVEVDELEVNEDLMDDSEYEDHQQIQRAPRARRSTTAQSRARPAQKTPASSATAGSSTQAAQPTPAAAVPVAGHAFFWARRAYKVIACPNINSDGTNPPLPASLNPDPVPHHWLTFLGSRWAAHQGLAHPEAYMLESLPAGYTCGVGRFGSTRRWVYGHPRGRFQGPGEMWPHFLWLMTGRNGRCGCVRCR